MRTTATPTEEAGIPEFLPLNAIRAAGEQRSEPGAWAYLNAAAGDGRAARRSRSAYRQVALVPRVCCDVSRVDLTTQWLGKTMPSPFAIAPMASHELFDGSGEQGTAEGAKASGVPLVLSMESSQAWNTVAADRKWCQLSPQQDTGLERSLIDSAEEVGAEAIVLTLDTPVPGMRYEQRLALPEFPTHIDRPMLPVSNNSWGAYTWAGFDWSTVEAIVDYANIPVLGKGILHADDARQCTDSGMAGVIVSNHGGRNFEALPAPLSQLPSIAEAVGEDHLVLVDGGIRSGGDILVALAHGAHGVLIGRPILWGLSAAGPDGVAEVLTIFRDELEQAMALCGVRRTEDVNRSLVASGLIGTDLHV